MVEVFENNKIGFCVLPDESFKVANALWYILSDEDHRGTVTIIEKKDNEECAKHFFTHRDKQIKYKYSSCDELDEDEIEELFDRQVKVYVCLGDDKTDADYTFVVDTKENITDDYDAD